MDPELQVIALRYRRTNPALEDERALDAYRASGVYAGMGIPFRIDEPAFPELRRTTDETYNLGLLGGVVAAQVSEAAGRGNPVLVTGGDCTHTTGVVGGLQQAFGADARIGLVWFDAHGDFNTPQTTLSGSLGGMPVAVCAGLAFPGWRESSGIRAPLPADRIMMVDVRNLDPAEASLIAALGIPIATVVPGSPGQDLETAVQTLSRRVDRIYLHIDSDILDERFVPNHGTREPGGPDLEQIAAAVEVVMASGKVSVLAVVSVYGGGPGREASVASGIELIEAGLRAWKKHGWPLETT